MASHPDANPDSIPTGPSDSPEQVSPSDTPARESLEDIPPSDADADDTTRRDDVDAS